MSCVLIQHLKIYQIIFKFINYHHFILFLIPGVLALGCLLSLVSLSSIDIYVSWNLWIFRFFEVDFLFLFDKIRVLFLMAILLISRRVLIFRVSYISNEKFFCRFHLLVLAFILSMVLLIVSPHLIRALFGWDGLGITSYLLVIYYGSSKSYNARMLTALSNRAGDGLILVTIGLLFSTLDVRFFWYSNFVRGSLITIFIVIAAFTKSAQVPFCAWLPAAIAAPTPVSSLVHSSTLVTAGVYLLLRHSNKFLQHSWGGFISVVGCLTIILASVSAFSERDIKKIVALSTLSQLGIIIMAIGVCQYRLAFTHLIIHAFFKAILFISTGNLIHSSGDYQALIKTGRLRGIMPVSSAGIIAGSMSLAGLPFMAAFYSKEPIIECRLMSSLRVLLSGLIILGVSMTIIYRIRLIWKRLFINFSGLNLRWKSESGVYAESGVIFLIFPSFIRGAGLSNYYLIFPKFWYYSETFKYLNYFILIAGVGISVFLLLKFKNLINFHIYFMFSLPNFSARTMRNSSLTFGRQGIKIDSSWLWFLILDSAFQNFNFVKIRGSFYISKILIFLSFILLIFFSWY